MNVRELHTQLADAFDGHVPPSTLASVIKARMAKGEVVDLEELGELYPESPKSVSLILKKLGVKMRPSLKVSVAKLIAKLQRSYGRAVSVGLLEDWDHEGVPRLGDFARILDKREADDLLLCVIEALNKVETRGDAEAVQDTCELLHHLLSVQEQQMVEAIDEWLAGFEGNMPSWMPLTLDRLRWVRNLKNLKDLLDTVISGLDGAIKYSSHGEE